MQATSVTYIYEESKIFTSTGSKFMKYYHVILCSPKDMIRILHIRCLRNEQNIIKCCSEEDGLETEIICTWLL